MATSTNCLPLDMYEKQQWAKVLVNIHKKAELDKSL
jgi:hypothetical protein